MDTQFVFIGNRRFVLEEMIEAGVNIKTAFIVANTHLERDLQNGTFAIPCRHIVIKNKQELLQHLKAIDFDVLVSNGCPYILPVSQLPAARYVNIHPSCLPDLRGVDPIIGAVLFAKDAGATCHVMDEGIDTGAIISQIRVPYTEDLDVITLYQLSFHAEKRAFREALNIDFQPQYAQQENEECIYYTRRLEDRKITFEEKNDLIIRKIKAFNNKSQGCSFVLNDNIYHVYGIKIMTNPFLSNVMDSFADGTVVFSYEGNIIFKKDRQIIRFTEVVSENNQPIRVGERLF